MGFIVTLILMGVLLILAEILLIPGVGIAGVFGLASLVGSCVYAFDTMGMTVGTIVTAINVALVVCLTIYILRAKTWKKFTLNTNIESKAMPDKEELVAIGDVGVTITRLLPVGSARFDMKTYEVKSLEGMVDVGVEVEVVLIEDNKIIVRPRSAEF